MSLSEPPPGAYPVAPVHPGYASGPFPSPEFHGGAPPGVVPPPPAVVSRPTDTLGPKPFFNGAPTQPRQKGRPRKRKPKDLEAMTANLGEYFRTSLLLADTRLYSLKVSVNYKCQSVYN